MTGGTAGFRPTRPAILGAAALGLLAAFLAVHDQALWSLVGMWDRNPMYSYGYLVAPVSFYMIWTKREALARLEPRPAILAGGAVLALWLGLLVVGRMGSLILFEQLAILVALAGIVLLTVGRRALAIVAVPLAYLLLMLPVWDVFTEPLHVPFQNLSANIGVRMLQLIGIPAHREGTFITLPSIQLEVARACSGVNYLVAVIALGLPLGYMCLRSVRRRIALVASAVFIAALSNSLRVALIGILVTVDPGTPLHGPGHVLHGLFVAGIGHVTLFVSLWFLGRAEAREAAATRATPPAATPAPGVRRPFAWTRASLAGAGAAALLFAATAAFLHGRVAAPVALSAELDALPAQLGTWEAVPFSQPPAPRWWPNADRELRRRYHAGGRTADIYVGYFALQRQAQEAVTPRAEPLHRMARLVTLASAGLPPLRANRAVVARGPERELTLFWYDVDGFTAARPAAVKLRTVWNAVVYRRTNAAVMSVTMPMPNEGDTRPAEAALEELACALDRALAAYLPGREGAAAELLVRRATGGS